MLLPRIVYLACVHGGLIVGSQAKRLAGETIKSDTSDWDLLIPFEKWSTIALMIPEDARPNKFGGWRFSDDKGNEVDMWPGSVLEYLTNCKTKYGGNVYAVDYIGNRVYSSSFKDVSL